MPEGYRTEGAVGVGAVSAPPEGTAPPGLAERLVRRKPVERVVGETGQGDGGHLRRSLGLAHLTMISIGATLGTGIFVVLGEAVPLAGPAVVISFVIAGVTALFSALAYAELAGMIPASGSAYSYSYATMGEFVAWVCGWCLMLTYAVSVAAVAVGWGQYINELLHLLTGLELPAALSQPPGEDGGLVNIPAAVLVALALLALLSGVQETARANAVMVAVKIATLVLFCGIAITAVKAGNFTPLMPAGIGGVSAAGATLFFSYIGFDAASTAGEEARNPQRDLPRAIMLSLVVVTALYCLVAFVAVGAVWWESFDGVEASLSYVLRSVVDTWVWSALLAVGAIIAISSVVLVVFYGQTRILFTMARDGLIPKIFCRLDGRGTPRANTLIVAGFVGLLAAVVPLGNLADATSIGTLFAFGLVNIAVLVLRHRRPDLSRRFRVPLSPLTPLLGAVSCAYLMLSMDGPTWVTFGLWMVAGLTVYFGYSMRNSRLEGNSLAGGARTEQ